MPTVDEKAGEIVVKEERTGAPCSWEDYSALCNLVTAAGTASENVTHQAQQALKRARGRLNACRYQLANLEAAGSVIDDALGSLIAKIGRFEVAVATLIADQEASGLDLSSLATANWAAVLHQRLLTRAGGFSTYLQSASNAPTGGGEKLAAWVPEYLTLRDG